VVSSESWRKLPGRAREKITETKKPEPLFSANRVSRLSKPVFFLSTSLKTVQWVLHAESLIVASKKKLQHDIIRPWHY